jgi:AmiR/NasT family two-component response regulator
VDVGVRCQCQMPLRKGLRGQAKGVVMERFNLDAVEAFELLTRLSQQSNIRLVEIAAALIDSEHPLKHCRR